MSRHLAKVVSPHRIESAIHIHVEWIPTVAQQKVNGLAGRNGPSARQLAASECVRGRENASGRRVATVRDWPGRLARCLVVNRWPVGTRGHIGPPAMVTVSNIGSERAFSMDPACVKDQLARHVTVFQTAWIMVSCWNNFKFDIVYDILINAIFTLEQFDCKDWLTLLNIVYIFLDVNALPSSVERSGVTMGAVVGSCVISFIIGLALTAVLCFYYLKRRKPSIPGSPHYISKQNSYVIVPLKEVRIEKSCSIANHVVFGTNISRKLFLQVNAKRQPSFSGSTNGNGTLRGKNNPNVNGLGSPKLYPKSLDYESATLKRNSHGQQHIRADLDQDKYYWTSYSMQNQRRLAGDLCVLVFKHVIFSCDLFIQWVVSNVAEHERELTHLAAAYKFYWSISVWLMLKWQVWGQTLCYKKNVFT